MEPVRLAVGGSHRGGEIEAREKYGRCGLRVEKDEVYDIAVEITDPLFDKTIPVAGTDGFTSWSPGVLVGCLMWSVQWRRRSPCDKWFHLLGTVGRSESGHFSIGAGGRSVMPDSGELFVFLNDLPGKYENNRGRLRLSITRVL